MTRFAVAENAEEESSSRTFIVGVILFLAWRLMVTYWSQIATGLLRPEVLSGLIGMGAGAPGQARLQDPLELRQVRRKRLKERRTS